MCGLLADEDYKGIQASLLSILLIKKKAKSIRFKREERQLNKDVASDRVIAENVSVECNRCGISQKIVTIGVGHDYRMYLQIFVALTDYHVLLHSLRNKHGQKYRGWLKLIYDKPTERYDKVVQRKETKTSPE